jgi:hypothetical protein
VVELIEKNPRLLEYLSVSRLSDKVQVIVAPPGAGLSSLFPRAEPVKPASPKPEADR